MPNKKCFVCGEEITPTQPGRMSMGKDYHTATRITDPLDECHGLTMNCMRWMQFHCEIERRTREAIAAADDATVAPNTTDLI